MIVNSHRDIYYYNYTDFVKKTAKFSSNHNKTKNNKRIYKCNFIV